MLKVTKIIILLIMTSFIQGKLSANYEKLAYDFKFNDLDGSSLNFSSKILLQTPPLSPNEIFSELNLNSFKQINTVGSV